MPSLSIIIPTLDEEAGVAAAIEFLASFRARGAEVIRRQPRPHRRDRTRTR
jgi:hypothetical protein